MRIATWNVNSLKARMPRVEEWLAYAQPDVLCLQETKLADDAFPHLAFSGFGYDSVHHGHNQWNGVAILSRVGIDDVTTGFDDETVDPYEGDARVLAATCDGVRVVSVYVPNGREVGTEFYDRKLVWFDALHDWLASTQSPDQPLAVLGDFNVAPEDRDVWSVKAFAGATHVTEPERHAIGKLREWGLVDAFREQYSDDEPLHLLGLPARRLPPAPRHAHRPRAGDAPARRSHHVVGRRPQRAQGSATVRPRAAARRFRLRATEERHEPMTERRWIYALGGLVAVLAIALAVVLVTRDDDSNNAADTTTTIVTTTSTVAPTTTAPPTTTKPATPTTDPVPADHQRHRELRQVPLRRMAEQQPAGRGPGREPGRDHPDVLAGLLARRTPTRSGCATPRPARCSARGPRRTAPRSR